MRTLILSVLIVAAAASLETSRGVEAAATAAPQTALQRLELIKAKNKLLLETQAATLKRLDELDLQAKQLKFMGKRN